jgi:nicotinate-nucleotide adenylyltransferase
MKTALYFGSFNPVHNYHITIANHLIEHEGIGDVEFVLSSQNPFKTELASFEDRLAMLKFAINGYHNMAVNTIESTLPTPSYTINTLNKLKQTYKNREYVIIMGIDNWIDIEKWKYFEYILENYEILVIPRIFKGSNKKDNQFDNHYARLKEYKNDSREIITIHPNTRLVEGLPLSEISSTFIRNEVKNGFSIKPYVDNSTRKYIHFLKLYK